MKQKMMTSALVILVILMTGCATRIGDFTVLSTKNVDMSRLGELDRSSRVTGEDRRTWSVPSMEEAVDRAIETEEGGVALIDVSIETVSGFFSTAWRVEGTVLIDPELTND